MNDSDGNIINDNRRAAVAYEGKRYTRYRKHTQVHTNVLGKVEEKHGHEADNHISTVSVLGKVGNIEAP